MTQKGKTTELEPKQLCALLAVGCIKAHSHSWACEIETVNLLGCRREEGWLAFLNLIIQDNSSNKNTNKNDRTELIIMRVKAK